MIPLRGGAALRVFLCFALGYLLSYALRSVNAVIAPVLMAELGLSNADLGLLSAAYFVSFAAMQLPLGVWLDHYGPRKTESALLLCAALGAVVFAMSHSLPGLWLGRALIGAGVSACLMAPFKAYRLWFSLEQQTQLASWMLVAGTSGALTATIPVTAALPIIGWRGVFWLVAALLVLVTAAIFFLLRDVEGEQRRQDVSASAQSVSPAGNAGAYARIFANPYFRRMALVGFVNQGIFIALQTLWAGPWMSTVLGMDQTQTGRILFVMNFCLLLGYIGLGWWAPRFVSNDGRRPLSVTQAVALGLFGTLVAQAAILAVAAPWAWILWLVLALCATVTTLIQTAVSLSFPAQLAGRTNTAYNLVLFIGAFLAQWGVGLLIDLFKAYGISAADAMRAAFALMLLLQAAAWLAFVFNPAQADHGD